MKQENWNEWKVNTINVKCFQQEHNVKKIHAKVQKLFKLFACKFSTTIVTKIPSVEVCIVCVGVIHAGTIFI